MAGSILKNVRKLFDATNTTTKSINKASVEVERLTVEANKAKAAGDTVRYMHLMEKATKLATDGLKTAEKAGAYKGVGEVGARLSNYVPPKFKEVGSLIKQFIKNVEKSKVYDQGIIKSTPKSINPFNGGGGNMKI